MCYESQISFLPSAKDQPFDSEAGTVRADRPGALSDGGRLFYAAEAKVRGACGALSFCLDSGGEPASLCSKGGGALLAQAGLGLAKVHEGHGLLGEGKSGDREGIKRDREVTV